MGLDIWAEWGEVLGFIIVKTVVRAWILALLWSSFVTFSSSNHMENYSTCFVELSLELNELIYVMCWNRMRHAIHCLFLPLFVLKSCFHHHHHQNHPHCIPFVVGEAAAITGRSQFRFISYSPCREREHHERAWKFVCLQLEVVSPPLTLLVLELNVVAAPRCKWSWEVKLLLPCNSGLL